MSATTSINDGVQGVAVELAKELRDAAAKDEPTQGIIAVLQRIKDEIVWTKALSELDAGKSLDQAVRTYPYSVGLGTNDAVVALIRAISDTQLVKVREDDIRETETRWWHTEPVPADVEHLSLEFRDMTARCKTWRVEEVWPPETVQCAPSETFERAAQRFRVQANQKHRHPFLPSMHFDAILKTERASFDSLADRRIADVLADLVDEGVVPYVRNDEDNREEALRSPSRYFQLWERTLPAWCSTPDHWIEPIPPPGYVDSLEITSALREQYYIKVPTLHVPANGRCIVPSVKKPDIISRALFVPVERTMLGIRKANLEREADLVPRGAHLIPGNISVDAARVLLGRVVQSSTEPRPDPQAPPAGKRRKINKYAAQRLGFAWGLELNSDGEPLWLHCVRYDLMTSEYVLPLSGQGGRYGNELSPLAIPTAACAWVGAAQLPADVKALKSRAGQASSESSLQALDEPVADAGFRMSYEDWYQRTEKRIEMLNSGRFAPVVEVGPDGAFVGDDLGTSKGEADEFEAEISGAKPGIWLMSITHVAEDAGAVDEAARMIRFVWIGEGSVNYDALPFQESVQGQQPTDAETDWEVVATFSVDSSLVCLFSKQALDSILSDGTDREAMLESFIDENEGTNIFVPGGVVTTGDDGEYEIEGRRDEEGRIVELRLRV